MSSDGTTGDAINMVSGRVSSPTIGYDDVPIKTPTGPRDDRLPARIGRYVVLDIVGIGGMGVVCTAYDPKLDRKVALKLLRQRDHDDPARTSIGQARLQREARALAKLKHPNIVAVHDVDLVDGRLYIAMDYVEGVSLDAWFEQTTRSWREVVEVFLQAANGLVAAHAAGITHRDFKPANVRLESSGRVVVLDFVLALAQAGTNTGDDALEPEGPALVVAQPGPVVEKNRRLTAVGRRVGTPAYMSPEQMLGRAVGPQTDQFAFGASLYEALYGTLPFRGDAHTAMWNAVEGIVSPPPKDREVPPWLHRVVLRLLQRDPEQRFVDMPAVIAALSQGMRSRQRSRAVAASAGALVLLGGLAWAYGRENPCPGADERIDARWGPGRSEALLHDFAATQAPFADYAAERTIAVLDERAQGWKQAHTEICEATRLRGEQSDALLDHRMACLDAALLEFGALVDVFAETDAGLVEHAVVATMGLVDPMTCRDHRADDADAAPTAAESERVAVVREQIARAGALTQAMRIEPACAAAQDAWKAAAELEHAPTRAMARGALIAALTLRGDFAQAKIESVAMINEAAAHRLFDAEADGWTLRLQLIGHHLRKPTDALADRLAAEVAVARAGAKPKQVAGLAHALAVTLNASGDLAAAAEQFQIAIRQRLETDGPDDPQLANARNDLGITLVRLARHREAQDAFRAALESNLRSLGPTHPMVASVSLNLGNAIAGGRGAPEESAALYHDALMIREAVFGANHPLVAEVLVAQGALARQQHHHLEAVTALRRAVTLFGGPQADDLRAGMALNNLGVSHRELDDVPAALEAFSQAIALFVRLGATGHPSMMRAYLRRCSAYVAAADALGAVHDCDTAVSLMARLPASTEADVKDLAQAHAGILVVAAAKP